MKIFCMQTFPQLSVVLNKKMHWKSCALQSEKKWQNIPECGGSLRQKLKSSFSNAASMFLISYNIAKSTLLLQESSFSGQFFHPFWSYFRGLIDAWSSLVRVSLKRTVRSATYENRKQINVPRVKWDLRKESKKEVKRKPFSCWFCMSKTIWEDGEAEERGDCCCWVFVKSFHWLCHA